MLLLFTAGAAMREASSAIENDGHQLLGRLRGCTGYVQGFPSPVRLASAAGLDVVRVTALPSRCEVLTDGRTIWCVDDDERRALGTRLFLGLASAVLGPARCGKPDVVHLAARLAAPPLLVLRHGVDETVVRQTWATESFLRAWCAQHVRSG